MSFFVSIDFLEQAFCNHSKNVRFLSEWMPMHHEYLDTFIREHTLVMTKSYANQLRFAFLLIFFREKGRFPRCESELEDEVGKRTGKPTSNRS